MTASSRSAPVRPPGRVPPAPPLPVCRRSSGVASCSALGAALRARPGAKGGTRATHVATLAASRHLPRALAARRASGHAAKWAWAWARGVLAWAHAARAWVRAGRRRRFGRIRVGRGGRWRCSPPAPPARSPSRRHDPVPPTHPPPTSPPIQSATPTHPPAPPRRRVVRPHRVLSFRRRHRQLALSTLVLTAHVARQRRDQRGPQRAQPRGRVRRRRRPRPRRDGR